MATTKLVTALLALVLAPVCGLASPGEPSKSLPTLPLAFEPDRSAGHSDCPFVLRGRGYTLSLSPLVSSTLQGQGNIFAGQLLPSVTSATVTGLPTTGGNIYVRLWTQLNGIWQYYDYTYVAATTGTLAAMTTPIPGAALPGSTVTFTWNTAAGATAYWLDVGTVQGQGNISAGQLSPTTTAFTVNNIPTNGAAIYVRLWTQFGNAWQYHDYAYTAAN